jgi:hypothetical protein
MKRLFFFLAIVPLFFSCGGDDDPAEPAPTKRQLIIGTWVLYEYATSKDYTKFIDVDETETLTFTQDTYTRVSQKSPQTPTSGPYTVDDLYLTLDGYKTYNLSFDGTDIMYLREYGFGEDNYILKYRRQR